MQEQWLPIPGFENHYEASSFGNIRRKEANKVLRPWMANGYPVVALSIGGKVTKLAVHRLITSTFFGTCPMGLEVNHINGARNDNRIENLEYVSRSENHLHRARVLKHGIGEGNGSAKLTTSQVDEIRVKYQSGMLQRELANEYGVDRAIIGYIVRGDTWKHLESASIPLRPKKMLSGDKNTKAKLTWEIVREIRRKHATGQYTLAQLGNEYGVRGENVGFIVRGITWKE